MTTRAALERDGVVGCRFLISVFVAAVKRQVESVCQSGGVQDCPLIGFHFAPLWAAAASGGSARAVGAGRGCGDGASAGRLIIVAAFDAPAVISNFDDAAMMR